MPDYDFTGSDGRKFTISFDHSPTDEDFQRATTELKSRYYTPKKGSGAVMRAARPTDKGTPVPPDVSPHATGAGGTVGPLDFAKYLAAKEYSSSNPLTQATGAVRGMVAGTVEPTTLGPLLMGEGLLKGAAEIPRLVKAGKIAARAAGLGFGGQQAAEAFQDVRAGKPGAAAVHGLGGALGLYGGLMPSGRPVPEHPLDVPSAADRLRSHPAAPTSEAVDAYLGNLSADTDPFTAPVKPAAKPKSAKPSTTPPTGEIVEQKPKAPVTKRQQSKPGHGAMTSIATKSTPTKTPEVKPDAAVPPKQVESAAAPDVPAGKARGSQPRRRRGAGQGDELQQPTGTRKSAQKPTQAEAKAPDAKPVEPSGAAESQTGEAPEGKVAPGARTRPASKSTKIKLAERMEFEKSLVGKRVRSYGGNQDDVLGVEHTDTGTKITVRDVKTGKERTHYTQIKPADVIGDTPAAETPQWKRGDTVYYGGGPHAIMGVNEDGSLNIAGKTPTEGKSSIKHNVLPDEVLSIAEGQAKALRGKAEGAALSRLASKKGQAGGVDIGVKRRSAKEAVEALSSKDKGTGRFKDTYDAAGTEVGDAMNKAAVASDVSNLEHLLAQRNVLGPLSDEQKSDIGKLLVSERLKTLNPSHGQVLDKAETQRILADPKIKAALKTHAIDVAPRDLEYSLAAGLDPAHASNNPLFVHLIPKGKEEFGIEGLSASAASRLRRKKTGFAQKATGTAGEYVTDLSKIYEKSFGETIRKAALRDVYSALDKKGLLKNDWEPGFTKIEVDRRPAGKGLSRITSKYVPTAVERDIKDVKNVSNLEPDQAQKAMLAYQRFVTGASLTLNPLEIFGHTHRQLSVLSKMPAVTAHPVARVAEAAINAVSAGANLGSKGGAFIRMWNRDWSTPQMQSLARDIMKSGGGTSRAFQEYTVSKIPGIRNIQQASHDFLFGIPEGKGVKGWDMRVRGELELIRRKVEGNTSPKRTREFLNQVGQYTSKPAKVIQLLKNFNPYLASQLPMRVTEARQLVGGSGLKGKSLGHAAALRTETLLRGTGGAVIGFFLANHYLSGKWPWENEPGHEFDLDLGNGNYIKPTLTAPDTIRALRSAGVPEVAKEFRMADEGEGQPGIAALTGPMNVIMETAFGGPGTQVPFGLYGKAPYFTKKPGSSRPELLSIGGQPAEGESQLSNNAWQTVARTNPILGMMMSAEERKKIARRYLNLPGVNE